MQVFSIKFLSCAAVFLVTAFYFDPFQTILNCLPLLRAQLELRSVDEEKHQRVLSESLDIFFQCGQLVFRLFLERRTPKVRTAPGLAAGQDSWSRFRLGIGTSPNQGSRVLISPRFNKMTKSLNRNLFFDRIYLLFA